MSGSDEGWNLDPDQVIVRDKRRLDPESGEVRHPVASHEDAEALSAEALSAEILAEEDKLAAELTADLQRVSAEYANYRKRVDRDRVAVVDMATAGLLSGLLPVLDDIQRAREHGDLTGGFASVAEALEGYVGKLGLEQYGEPGEPFDPAVHEALMQAEPDPAATEPICAQVMQKGYRLSSAAGTGRVLRPARVSVAEPGAAAPDES